VEAFIINSQIAPLPPLNVKLPYYGACIPRWNHWSTYVLPCPR